MEIRKWFCVASFTARAPRLLAIAIAGVACASVAAADTTTFMQSHAAADHPGIARTPREVGRAKGRRVAVRGSRS